MKELLALTIWNDRLSNASQRFLKTLVCLLFCLPVTTILASSLDPQARQQAQLVADTADWIIPASRANTRNKNPHPLGVQTLSIEKLESKGNTTASVLRVYQYHYDLMQARLLTVDVSSNQLLKSQLVNSVHLPLNQAEIDHASTLLQTHSDIIKQLRNEQINRGHSAFNSLSELDLKASIFEPHDPAHQCARQRCALLSLFDDTRTVFSTEPVINLQIGKVELLDNS